MARTFIGSLTVSIAFLDPVNVHGNLRDPLTPEVRKILTDINWEQVTHCTGRTTMNGSVAAVHHFI